MDLFGTGKGPYPVPQGRVPWNQILLIKKVRSRFNGTGTLIVRPKISIRVVNCVGDRDTLDDVLEVGGGGGSLANQQPTIY